VAVHAGRGSARFPPRDRSGARGAHALRPGRHDVDPHARRSHRHRRAPARGVALPTAAASLPAPPSAERPSAALATQIRADLEPALPWIVVAWLAGVVILSIRLASGWLVTRRLSSVGTRPVPPACREALARLVVRLRVTRPVRVRESAVVQVPAVIGWLRPVVLLPASALTGLTPLQLDALLAHELAHVR